MAETSLWHFGPFHLDMGAERLWREHAASIPTMPSGTLHTAA
jgi:hypothetical protein